MNRPYDRYGNRYNISQVVDERANFVQEKYEAYSVHLLRYHLIVAFVCYRRIHDCFHLLLRILLFYRRARPTFQSSTDARRNKKYFSTQKTRGANHRHPL